MSRVGLILVMAGIVFLLSPLGRYLARGAWEESQILLARRPISAVLADSSTAPGIRQRLRLVLAARDFASQRLGLDAAESFTTFTQLKHDTLVLVLSAAPRDRLEAHTWWFPLVGSVPYKGFFDFGEARKAAERLRANDLDTYLRPASAFSTLGWFNDPLLSTTLREDTVSLANTVIHELTHNTVFVPSHVDFNESLANFVGGRGAIAFFDARGQPGAAEYASRMWQDEKEMASFWKSAHAAIDSAFAAHPSDSLARLQARAEVYGRLRRELLDERAPRLTTIPRAALERIALDNASLLAHRVYATDLGMFDDILQRNANDLRATIQLIAERVRDVDDPVASLRAWLQRPAPDAAPS